MLPKHYHFLFNVFRHFIACIYKNKKPYIQWSFKGYYIQWSCTTVIQKVLYQVYPPLNRPICGTLAIVSHGASLSPLITAFGYSFVHSLRAPYTTHLGLHSRPMHSSNITGRLHHRHHSLPYLT